MQTTHKIPGGSAVTWSKYLTSHASRGDYYTQDGKEDRSTHTQWHGPGQLLRSYGIDPERPVELKHLRPLMQGFSPVDGEPIRPAGSNGTRTAGVDLTFSPPKDVSALWATSSPYRRAQIEVAHRKAEKSALDRTEREVALVRRKTNGLVRFEKAKRLLAVEAVHTTSRLARDQDTRGIPDPQLHSHVAVIAAERQDGKIAAIESKQLYLAAREGGGWYRSELASNLEDLGLTIERRTGKNERYFGIQGVSKELSEHWSSRSQDVDRAARLFRQRYGREPGPGELDSLTLGTRGTKSAADSVDIDASWRALGAEHNQTAERSEELFNDQSIRRPQVDLGEELLEEVTRERSMITERELKAKAYELSTGVCRPADADRMITYLQQSGELLKLEDGSWTTRQLRELEEQTIEIAEQRATEIAAPVGEQSLKQARLDIGRTIKGTLTQEQRDALDTITGPGGITLIVGKAGTGKGVVISTAARAWQLEGFEVIGTSVAGATAQRLKADTGLDRSYTADQLIYGIKQGRIRIGPNTVIVFDEAAMADHKRLAPLVKLTAERGGKTLLVGDAAQISPIGPGGLFAHLEDKVPTAELHEVHRANHEWERQAWQQVRAGEPGPALAQYQAHDRLHIHDTRAQATEAMVDNWDQMRKTMPDGRAVMITDASNLERDQMNAMAQERRAQAGELGSHRVQLPGKPYGLAAGDEIIFSAKCPVPGERRIENGITGTVIDTSRDEDKVTIRTNEHGPRDIAIDTSEFSDLSLSYAVHVNKAQGMTTETSGILTGGWQTNKEHAYVAVSRAREQTKIYVSREDLGEQGFDTGAMERLAERIKRSRAQEASIAQNVAERTPARQHTTARERHRQQDIDDFLDPHRGRPNDYVSSEQPGQPERDRLQSDARDRFAQYEHETNGTPIDIHEANPADIRLDVRDLGDIQVTYSTQLYDIKAQTGETTHVLFGGWQTEQQLGFVAAVHAHGHTDIRMTTENREGRDIQTELRHRIGQIIERSQVHEATDARDRYPESAELAERTAAQPLEHGPQIQPEPERVERDPYIEQAIQQAQERQQAFEQGIDHDRDDDRDLGHGIE